MITFASGLSESPTELATAITAGCAVGIAAQVRGRSVSQPIRQQLIDHANHGGTIFIDSGAFTAWRKGTTLDWSTVFFSYREIIQSITPEHRHRVHIVAPDIVGDYHGSRHLQLQLYPEIQTFLEGGVTVIVPVQKPNDPDRYENLIDAVADSIPVIFEAWLTAPNLIVGIPFNACAWTHGEVRHYLQHTTPEDPELPPRIHLLGGGSTKVQALQADLATLHLPHIQIHGDSLIAAASARKHHKTKPIIPASIIPFPSSKPTLTELYALLEA